MSRSTSSLASATLLASAIVSTAASAGAQQSDLSISPFVSFLPSAGSSPLAGLALTVAGTSAFGVRASAHLALENTNSGGFEASASLRPWGVDADAVLALGRAFRSYNRTFAPYVFAGIGTGGGDGVGTTTLHSNWSYGAGAMIPLGAAVDVFGESRWRMSQFVLPTATLAPAPVNELRVGLSFHVGGSGNSRNVRDSGRPRDRRAESMPATLPATARYPTTITASAARVLGTSDQYIGVPYHWGGTSPSSGFDCSGFVQYVFAQRGVRLPRTARDQAQVGTALSPDWRAVSAGDLVMFEENGRIDHVAIYAGRNRIIHASASGGGVRYDDLTTQRGAWFVDHMVAARRVTTDANGLTLDLARGFATGAAVALDGPDHAPKPAP